MSFEDDEDEELECEVVAEPPPKVPYRLKPPDKPVEETPTEVPYLF